MEQLNQVLGWGLPMLDGVLIVGCVIAVCLMLAADAFDD